LKFENGLQNYLIALDIATHGFVGPGGIMGLQGIVGVVGRQYMSDDGPRLLST
jgi:hypothetical protein